MYEVWRDKREAVTKIVIAPWAEKKAAWPLGCTHEEGPPALGGPQHLENAFRSAWPKRLDRARQAFSRGWKALFQNLRALRGDSPQV